MAQKVMLVTGATAGIGKMTTLALAQQGNHVVVVGRDEAKTYGVVEAIRQATGNPLVDPLIADLSSIRQTVALADQFRARYGRLDVLVNNVGAVFLSRGLTVDGIENTLALNYLLGRFALTRQLLDLLQASAPARIVNVASSAHFLGRIHFDDLGLERAYGPTRAYAQAKLADVMFTYELARRMAGAGVTANVLHPGVVSTNFLLTNNRVNWVTRSMRAATDLFAIDEAKGAETSVYLTTSPDIEAVTGRYFVRKKARRSSAASYREADQRRLWEVSEQMLARLYDSTSLLPATPVAPFGTLASAPPLLPFGLMS